MNLPKTKEELYGKYYLKSDLITICKENSLPTTGSKENLLEYICCFIEKTIDANYSNNEIHRAFFRNVIGENFKFNIQFMNWMEKNKGKGTYKIAVKEYAKILSDKKAGKKINIGKQFEYNQYTRDFFVDNPELSREDCIKCWNSKKNQIGNHKYEKDDLKYFKR